MRGDRLADPAGAPADDRGVLRFLTCGSVDDGKSTLIGRLLYDTKALLTDTLATLHKHAQRRGLSVPDLSLLTDGLVAEREQGITIDVAYRYFATAQRKFIIADSPGHVQYTRNMVTAASTADAAVLLVDARKGIAAQTRRHATIAGLLGVQHLIVAVNKMDLVGYSQTVFESIGSDFRAWLDQHPSLHVRTDYIPISALEGANVVERDERLGWTTGPTLIELLEQAPTHQADAQAPLRLPVQWICRPSQSDFRGCAGRVESGTLTVGDEVVVLPSGRTSRVAAIRIGERDLDQAVAGESVLVQFADELDISRGDLIARAGDRVPEARSTFDVTVCWLGQRALEPRREYLMRHGTRETRVRVRQVTAHLDIEALAWQSGAGPVEPNGIAQLAISTQHPIAADAYESLRATGSFILVDPTSFDTVAAGMIS
ncbi:MAG TPA: GTP-binding protein [Burkholderiaceae bacterium]|jgi:sulfate adenylyltransferase subunit 1|nr:GTP-binding protein [Burkholderiaceae bacterium]